MNTDEINAIEQQITALKTKLTELRRALPPEPVADFCAVWPLLDLLKDGAANWEPDYRL